jgi:hypothetical protein
MLDINHSLLRGRYSKAAAEIEARGVPMDTGNLGLLNKHADALKAELVRAVDRDYRVYEGTTFKRQRFEAFLAQAQIPWPRHESGVLDMRDETFRDMARVYPRVAVLAELRRTLSQLQLSPLPVGADGRNRYMLSPFRSRTGRNQPKTSQFILNRAAWMRALVLPPAGTGLAYIDWAQQEFGIAAALSGDVQMMRAYESGDPYLAFAKQAGAVPVHGTKDDYPEVREQFKACVLAVGYGMGADALALRVGRSPARARELLRMHRQAYPRFWQWANDAVDHGYLTGRLTTTFGWTLHAEDDINPRSLRNFPMQANGAEMLRLACIFGSEAGVRICALLHDAVLIEAPLRELEEASAAMQAHMERASEVVLDGFPLSTDVKLVRHPNRFVDERGEAMWKRVLAIVERLERNAGM